MARSRVTSRSGFTVPELLVAMIVMTILSAAVVGTTITWLASYTTSGQRVQTATDLRFSLSQISTDISQSYVAQTSPPPAAVPDTPPPMPVGGWIGGAHVLILGKTPRSSVDGSALYASPDTYEGDPDSIIYYLSGTDLYRRVVPVGGTTYPNNALGATPTQTKVLSGVTAFDVGYYDDTNTPSVTITDASSISVLVTATRQQAGKTFTYTDKIQIALQEFAQLTPPDVDLGTLPSFHTRPGMVVGNGGLSVIASKVAGPDIYVKGAMSVRIFSRVTATGKVDVENRGCYANPNYNICGGEAIKIPGPDSSKVSGNQICGVNQTDGAKLTVWAGAGCTINPTVSMPAFSKANFVGAMPSPGSSPVSCVNATQPFPAGTTINGDVDIKRGCTMRVQGNVYIKGNLSVYSGTIIPDVGVTTNRPVIVVDGRITFKVRSSVKTNASGIAPIFISYFSSHSSTNTSCISATPPSPLTPTQIYESVKSTNFDFQGTSQAIGVYSSTIKGSLYAACDSIILKFANITGSLAAQSVSVQARSAVRLAPGIWPN